MTVTYSIRIEGVESTLKTLGQVDKELLNKIKAEVKDEVDKAAVIAKAGYPSGRAIRNWNNKPTIKPKSGSGFPNYDYNKARAGVKSVVAKKTASSKKSWKIAALQQKNAGGVIFDMAGSKSPGNGSGVYFVSKLTGEYGRASRIMWPAMRAKQASIVNSIQKGVNKAATELSLRMIERRDR